MFNYYLDEILSSRNNHPDGLYSVVLGVMITCKSIIITDILRV
jgi:hypothetical protein